jgi:di/tricarboxylate transporter
LDKDLIILAVLLSAVFGLLIWGRWRYDLVAFTALVVALLTGVVPADQAFSGFGHPATVIIALVLIASRGLSNSGAIELMTRHVIDAGRKLGTHIAVMTGFAAALSAVMNNVAALALLMPVDLQAAEKAKRSPSLTLMPLSFATILGGMITLIGTPPNIVIAEYRNDALGESFRMFDFAPVGIACTVVGLLFIATIGWRLIPTPEKTQTKSDDQIELEGDVAEVQVPEDSAAIGNRVRDLDDTVEEHDAVILGLVRRGKRLPGMARRAEIRAGDVLVLQASPSAIDALVGELGLSYDRDSPRKSLLDEEDLAMLEVVVPEDARIEGRSALSIRLLGRHGVLLVGVSRQGKRFRERVRGLTIQPGDVLLLLGPSERLPDIAAWLGCLSLAERGLQVVRRDKAWQAVTIFGAAIVLASTGVIYLPVALAATVALMVMLNIVPLRQVYDSVAWPVVVLLGSMIPLGAALESSGGTAIIADVIVGVTGGLSPAIVLALLIAVTMTLSDVMNNTATAVIAAPVAIEIASRLGVSPDPFLMGVAVAASCAFLTPIGHKNNTLILGPGGYRFGDYWRMGLPLEVLIVLVSTPMILWVWPL